jgi:hypothetical protein
MDLGIVQTKHVFLRSVEELYIDFILSLSFKSKLQKYKKELRKRKL